MVNQNITKVLLHKMSTINYTSKHKFTYFKWTLIMLHFLFNCEIYLLGREVFLIEIQSIVREFYTLNMENINV